MTRRSGTASGALANLAAQGVPFLLLIVVTPILLRALGREQYGVLVLFNLVPQIAGQLDLGISTAAMRGFAQHSARGDRSGAMRLFREALVLLVAWGLVLGGIFYLCHAWIADALKIDTVVATDSLIYVAAAIAIPIALANGATLVPLRALERYGRAARIQVTAGIGYWIACAWWAAHGGTLTQLVWLGTLAVALPTIALWFAARGPSIDGAPPADAAASAAASNIVPPIDIEAADVLSSTGPVPSPWLLRPFLPLGAGAFVAQASSLATYHADKLLVSALISPAAAGAYAICTSIANKILLVIAATATFTFPRSARMHAEGDLDAIASTFARTTRLAMLIAACIAITLIALAPSFLDVWIGAAFARDYGLTLQVLAFGYAIAASSVVASNVAIGIGEVRIPAVFALFGGTLTLVAVWILAPRYGAAGAAAAAAIGMTQALVFNDVLAKRLGPPARSASWPLLWRLVAIGAPVGIVAASTRFVVTGWLSLIAFAATTAAVFLLLWLATFGRVTERALLNQLLIRANHAPDHH